MRDWKENGDFNPKTANVSTLDEFTMTSVNYQVTLETMPNHVLYEATVAFDKTTKLWSIVDEVSRTSGYANDAHARCVLRDFPEVSKFCSCRQ